VARSLLVYDCGGTEYVMAGTAGDYVYRADTAVPILWTQFNGLTDPPDGTVSGFQNASILTLFFEENEEILFAGTENKGVHRSEDCGELWEQISNLSLQDGYRVIQSLVFDPNNDRLYGGTFGFGVIMSPDFGEPVLSWTRVNNQLTNPWIYAMEYAQHGSKDYVYAGTWGDGIFRTLDGGERWVFMGLANRIIYDMAFDVLNGILFAATDRGEISRSVDYGLTWQEVGVAQTAVWAIGIDPVEPDTVYAGTFGRGIYKSNDGGGTWAQSGMATGYVFDFAFGEHPETATPGIFAATAEGVQFSSDGGQTWSDLSVGLTVIDTRAVAFANDGIDDILLAGTWGGGVFLYDTASHSWIRDGMPSAEITTFAISPVDGEVFVAASGKGLYRRSFGSTVTSVEDRYEEVPDGYVLEQNYPNPFNPQTTIQIRLPEAGEVRLAVYDVLGRQVRVLAQGVLSQGTHHYTFDATDLASGIYFYQLESASEVLTRTMILMK